MVGSRFFRGGNNKGGGIKGDSTGAEIDQGFYYMYLVLGLQVLFLFALLAVMMLVGKVLATPWWVFLLLFLGAVGGCVFLYMRIKRKFKDLKKTVKETLKDVDLSGKNYEIRIMGGVLTLRVEQSAGRLIESRPAPPLLEDRPYDLEPGEGGEPARGDKGRKPSGDAPS
jgi:hypothetical protein